jgi:hypothetical protein
MRLRLSRQEQQNASEHPPQSEHLAPLRDVYRRSRFSVNTISNAGRQRGG